MRSAYSSVSKRETSFSRIGLDSVVDSNPIIYPVLEFDIRRSGENRGVFGGFSRYTIGRSTAFGKPLDQSQERLNNSVYGFCPYRTTEPFTISIRKTA